VDVELVLISIQSRSLGSLDSLFSENYASRIFDSEDIDTTFHSDYEWYEMVDEDECLSASGEDSDWYDDGSGYSEVGENEYHAKKDTKVGSDREKSYALESSKPKIESKDTHEASTCSTDIPSLSHTKAISNGNLAKRVVVAFKNAILHVGPDYVATETWSVLLAVALVTRHIESRQKLFETAPKLRKYLPT
jgi:hypothetical protein